MQIIHPIFEKIIDDFKSKHHQKNYDVKREHKQCGGGGIWVIYGTDKAQVIAFAKSMKLSIDIYRCPIVSEPIFDEACNEWVCEVKYFGLD